MVSINESSGLVTVVDLDAEVAVKLTLTVIVNDTLTVKNTATAVGKSKTGSIFIPWKME